MKYLLFNVLADGTPTTRFARELALEIDKAGEDIRVHQLGHARIGGEIVFVSHHFLEKRYHRLVDLMFGPPRAGTEMYLFGDIKEAVGRILQPNECAPINYAFITLAGWGDTAHRLPLARGLANYDRVFVFSESDQAELERLGVSSEVVGDVSEYIHIEAVIKEEEVLGRLLVIVPVDGRVEDEVLDTRMDKVDADLCGDDVCNVSNLDQDVWNMSKARNLGIIDAHRMGFDYVAFNDIDIEAPVGYWREVKKILAQSPDNIVVPNYVGSSGTSASIASGNIAMHVSKALEVDGYDENYVGGGGEDVDFLFRLNRDTVSFQVTPNAPPLVHHDHPTREDRVRYNLANEDRIRRVMDYEDLDVESCLIEYKKDMGEGGEDE